MKFTLEQEFWAYVKFTDSCWLWQGAFEAGRRYGSFKNKKAHRIACEISVGKIPHGQNVCHHCDDGLYVRPDHLFTGTQKDNMADCASKGRIVSRGCASAEHAEKIRQALLGKKHPPERRHAMSKAWIKRRLKGPINVGRPVSEETREKIRIGLARTRAAKASNAN